MPHVGEFDQNGNYTPPPGVLVHFRRGGANDTVRKFALNPRASWDGTNADAAGFWAMFSQGTVLDGWFISQIGVEGETGEGGAMALYLAEQAAKRPVTLSRAEMWQFSIANSPSGKRLETSDWPKIVGRESPIEQPTIGTKTNPIVVRDVRFGHGIRKTIGGQIYQNDLTEESVGKGPFPEEVKPVEPPLPPPPSPTTKPPATPPPIQPNPPAKGGAIAHEINYRFDGRKEFTIPVGARSVVFHGELLLGGPVTPETRSPIISTKLGPKPKKGKRRFDAGTAVLNVNGGLAIEANDKPISAGGPPLSIGVPIPFTYEWTAGVGAVVSAGDRDAAIAVAKSANQGGVVVLGVERDDDPEADYVLLPEGSVLSGILTINLAGARPGEPPPPPSRLEEAVRAAIASLTKALEGKS